MLNLKKVLLVLFALVAILAVNGKTVTFQMQTLSESILDDNLKEVDVNKVLVGADNYFSGAKASFLFPGGDNAILFGYSINDTSFPVGTLVLTLAPWFQKVTINSVAVETVICYTNGVNQYSVYLYANGEQSSDYIIDYGNDDPRTLTSKVETTCDELKIEMRASKSNIKKDSRAYVYSITIDYEGEDAQPVEIDPAVGIDGLEVGQSVVLKNCVIEEHDGEYMAHVVRTENGQPVVEDNQPAIYSLPVIWESTPTTGENLGITGTIVEVEGKKFVKIQDSTPETPTLQHIPPTITINGDLLENQIIKASDKIEFTHPYGDNVVIYYTKRRGVTIDPDNAKIDPAIVATPTEPAHAPALKADASETNQEENETYIYTGPFRLVHPSKYTTTPQSTIALTMQVHSGPSLTAGAAFAPSEAYTVHNEVTTDRIDPIVTTDGKASFFDLLGRPVAQPQPGQVLLRQTAKGTSAVILSR